MSEAPKSFARRDKLLKVEKEIQLQWSNENIYETERKYDENGNPKEKFMVTFPYPYMNGTLHLGHAFSFTKAEFTARFQRLLGKNVLFPFGFHCTGMPIQAAANKLKNELLKYGNPPVFPSEEEEAAELAAIEAKKAATKNDKDDDVANQVGKTFKGSKAKLVAKGMSGKKTVRTWDILKMMVPEDQIAEFADPVKWLEYFPPLGAKALSRFGSCIDWRRSFITTSQCKFYDAFIRWQFNHLYKGNKVRFGKRANVFSPIDGQVCADHDRDSGEGVGPQEYTLIKLLVKTPYPENSPLNDPVLAGKDIYLTPATLRPETMYGQTNCFVLPEGEYGAFEAENGDILVVSQRSAVGMSYQNLLKEWSKATPLVLFTGEQLLGLPLIAPNAVYDVVYTLPLLTISMGKGTGVVTSVPSDAPDDYAALRELKEKPVWREKFGISSNMVEPYEVVPIIEIEGYGQCSAVTMCERLDIKSYKEADKLKKAKEEVYLKGFYEGIMLVGECQGMKVCDAKPIIRESMIKAGQALPYYEPESLVMSRSGGECVVALTDQWYLAYGDEEWAQTVSEHINSDAFNGYNKAIMEKFNWVLGWLKEWACSRMFGLGTNLPWDQQWVIESLSDSTIYMAYYTIAHFLHGGIDNLTGDQPSPAGINVEEMTDEVFDFIFLRTDYSSSMTIAKETLEAMRAEFEYWYPMDLRVSAKDLIPNHLTMALYNHVEIWKDRPELWPKGIYCNGHVCVDAEKMSKSKGNFLQLEFCIDEYSADATRFALADAGDSMEDANFDRKVVNQAISNLYTEDEWITSIMNDVNEGKLRTGDKTLMDQIMENEVGYLCGAVKTDFEAMCYRDGLLKAWYMMVNTRDAYRDWAYRCQTTLHADVVRTYCNALVVFMAPITPHWSDNLYRNVLKMNGSVVDAAWPVPLIPIDLLLRRKMKFFNEVMKNARQSLIRAKAKGERGLAIFLTNNYKPNNVVILQTMKTLAEKSDDGQLPVDIISQMKEFVSQNDAFKKEAKFLLQFAAFMAKETVERGLEALETDVPFDQLALLESLNQYITSSLGIPVTYYYTHSPDIPPSFQEKIYKDCKPLKPSFNVYTLPKE